MVVAHATLHAVYLLCVAVVFGGTLALSFVSAPLLFREIPDRAGGVFGFMLARFDGIAFKVGVVATVAAALLVGFGPDRIKAGIEAVLAAALALVFLYLRKVLTPRLENLAPPREGEDTRPEGALVAFDRLHKRYVRLYALNLFVSAAALALP
jgi:hypothetical protein